MEDGPNSAVLPHNGQLGPMNSNQTGLGISSSPNVNSGSSNKGDPDGGGNNANGGGVNPQRSPQSYSIPGILHFIQHEWARFEMERSQWDVERAELQVTTMAHEGHIFLSTLSGHLWAQQFLWKETRHLTICGQTAKSLFAVISCNSAVWAAVH